MKSFNNAVKQERTGWRDQKLSERHRLWGWDCPAVDIDFLMLEYDKGKAVALVEYKHQNAPMQKITHPTYQALIDLGNRAKIPVFNVRYADSFLWWIVTPLNSNAQHYLPEQKKMTEQEWVAFLYRLRGRKYEATKVYEKETPSNGIPV